MAKANIASFPETVHVVIDENSDSNPPSMIVERSVEEAIDEDGPTLIADYKLVQVRKFRKVVKEF